MRRRSIALACLAISMVAVVVIGWSVMKRTTRDLNHPVVSDKFPPAASRPATRRALPPAFHLLVFCAQSKASDDRQAFQFDLFARVRHVWHRRRFTAMPGDAVGDVGPDNIDYSTDLVFVKCTTVNGRDVAVLRDSAGAPITRDVQNDLQNPNHLELIHRTETGPGTRTSG